MITGRRLTFFAIGTLALTSPALGQSTGDLLAIPFSRGKMIFTTRSTGEGKAIFCIQDGPTGKPRVLLDSDEDTYLPKYPIESFSVSDDGRYFTYFTPQIPHRFEQIHVIDIRTGKNLSDLISWTYLSDMAWDGDGFFYGAYPKPADADAPKFSKLPRSTADHLGEKLFYHRIGNPVTSDALAYEDPAHPDQKYLFLEGFNRRWMHVHILQSLSFTAKASEWFARAQRGKLTLRALQPEFDQGRFYSCDDPHDKFLLFTKYKSPNGRVILVDPRQPGEEHWKTIVPSTNETMASADPAAGKLILTYILESGGNRVEIRNQEGKLETTLPVPLGSLADIQWSAPSEKQIFFSLTTPAKKKIFYRYELATGKTYPFP